MKRALLSTILSALFIYLFCFTAGQCLAASDSSTSKAKPAATDPNAVTKSGETNFLAEKKYVPPTEKASDYDLFLKRHSIELGAETYSFLYEEPGDIEDKSDFGGFYGGSVSYIYRWWVPASADEPLLKDNRGSLRGEFRYDTGEADYDGHLSDGTPYKVNDIEYNTIDGRILIGLDSLNKNWLASLSTGVGYRYSNDDSSFDPNGYERNTNYIYIPLAYQIDSKFVNNWAIGCKLEADLVTWGEQKRDFSIADVTNEVSNGWGLRASIRLQNRTPVGIFMLEPFIRYWDIGKSDRKVVNSVNYVAPENDTTELGVQVVWKF